MNRDRAARNGAVNRDRRPRLDWRSIAVLVLCLAPGIGTEGTVGAESTGRETVVIEDVGIEGAYLETLAAWARGSRTAVSELSDLQQRLASHAAGFEISRETFARLPSKPVHVASTAAALHKRLPGRDCLRQIQRHVHERLADDDPESLLALAYFYQLLYAEQMGGVLRPWLAESNKERVFRLTELYLEKGKAQAARRNAVAMLIDMADALGAVGSYVTGVESRDTFLRALRLDPGNSVAMYWLAYLEERFGDYDQAVKYLERLASKLEGDAEVLLRLAVNRARTGRAGTAARRLEEVARGDGPEWTRIVAYQQLGQQLAEKDTERAARWLREAVDRFPDNHRLQLQLSYLRHAEWQRSSALAHAVEAAWDGDPGGSPRLRYTAARRDEIDLELERLRLEVGHRLPAMAQGLSRLLDKPWLMRFRAADCPRELP